MLPELQATALTFATGEKFLSRLIDGFTDADWRVRDAVGHDPRWLVGHLSATRQSLLKLVGLAQPTVAWAEPFGRGKSAADLPADLDLGPVIAAFQASQPLLDARWEALTAEDLAKPFGRVLPNGTDTLGGALQFYAFHEAYHIGQLGFLRCLTGRPGLA